MSHHANKEKKRRYLSHNAVWKMKQENDAIDIFG
jgi:hypothetical protein